MARVITAADVEEAIAGGAESLALALGDVVTPLARERADELGLVFGSDQTTGAGPDLSLIARVVAEVLATELEEGEGSPATVAEVCQAVVARLAR